MKYINEYNSNNTYFYETDESDWLSSERAVSENNDKYYKSIDFHKYSKLNWSRVGLGDRETKSEKLKYFTEKEITTISNISAFFCSTLTNLTTFIKITKKGYYTIYIYKLEDEWYLINFLFWKGNTHKYYMCDQLDGLVIFLNDNMGTEVDKKLSPTNKFLLESANQNEYKPITINEADTYLNKIVDINLSNKQLEIIYNFFNDVRLFGYGNYQQSPHLNDYIFIKDNFRHSIIKIFEIEDEWFIVSIESPANNLQPMGKISLFWKCDQFSGLIQFLNDYKSPFYNLHRMRESINNDMYKPIGKEPYNSIDIKKQISIDDRTFSAIDKLCSSRGINCNKKKEIHSDGHKLTHAEIYKHIKQGKYTIKVRQHEDDWYIVSIFYESYSEDRIIEIYKCDQIDGLIKCLKDILCNI